MKSFLPIYRCTALSLAYLATLFLNLSCSAQTSLPNTPSFEKISLAAITRTHTLNHLFLTTQPTEKDFHTIQKAGLKTVVNFRYTTENKTFNEENLVTKQGLTYIHLPWNGVEELTSKIFSASREVLNTQERPMLIHCKSANRVGAIWIVWRVIDGGISIETAVNEAKSIGLTNEDYETKARQYILHYSLKTDC